jgi:Ca2+/Na+ antiporter
VTIHQKTSIGRLSAFCGAVSAAAGAGAGIAYLLGADLDGIAHTVVNTIATTGGMVCDGAKSSCATKIATAIGLSEAVIGITIVSAGSSLPELAVSVNAARKKSPGIALGNVLGSNIMNIFLILGCTATICPIGLSQFSFVDFYVLVASSLLIYIVAKFGGKATITRPEGAILACCYVAYTAYLIYNN